MFKKYNKEIFLLILVSLLLISISAISAGDVSNSTTTSPTVTVEKQVSMSNVIKEDTTDNKVLSKNSENIQTKEKTDNKKTIKKETSNVDYYVCDNSGSDSNTGSQDSPFKTIGYAVGKVNSNDNYNIHIKNGTYKGTGNTNLTIDGNKYINFIGDGINQTIIDGESEYTIQGGTVWGDDPYFNTYNITKGNWAMNITSGNGKITIKNLNFQHMVSKGGNNINAYPTATIDNYANLEVDNVYFYENLAGVGAGIRSNDGSTLVVNNSIFESNRKSSSTGNFGAGIYNNGTATIHNSQFIDNAARWGTVTNDKVLTIVNSTFRNGHAYNLASTFKFGSGIAANTGSADFYNQHNGSVTLITNITKCTFENNEQTDIYQGKGNLYVNECVFKNSTGIYIANENTYNNSMKHVIENSNFTDMQPSTILLSFFDRTTPTFAIYNLGQYNTTIRNNQITTNIGSHALYLKGYNNITNNNIEGFIYITGKNNTLTDNTLKYNKTYVVELTSSAYNNTITDNSITASIFTGDRAVKTANNENIIENNTINTGSDYTITEANYNDFFDTNGDIKNVPTGSKLTLQTLNNKQLNIKNVNVYITNDNTSILNNCSIYVDNTAKVTIYGLNIQNTNNKDYVIKVNSKDNTIEANNITVNTNTPIHTITITDDRNTIYNNTIITNGPSNNITYTDNYGIADTIGLLIQSSNNIVELNKITTINTTTQPYGTINGISIQNKTNRHTNNLIRNNTITTQTNDYAYSINLQNTDENIIIGNNITTTSNNYANGIQLIDSNKNYINAKINITATNNAYGVVISGINTIPADNNITVNMNLTANNVYGVDLYNTNNTIITSNDSTSPYYLYGNSIMVNMYKANYTDISFLTPYQNGTSTAFNVINSSNVAINGINYTQQTNGIKYNTGTYTQITNSTDVYIGILVKGNYTENATINTPKTPIQITNSQLININGLKITTTKHTINLTNTNNSIIQNNLLMNSLSWSADETINQIDCENVTLINNTNGVLLENNILTDIPYINKNIVHLTTKITNNKSIKKAEESIILTEENYNQYFTNGILNDGITTITLGSDLYNKNITITGPFTELNNPKKYTLYNSTITFNGTKTDDTTYAPQLNNITIINTDERKTTIIGSGDLYSNISFVKGQIIQKNDIDTCLINSSFTIVIINSTIKMDCNKAIITNSTQHVLFGVNCTIKTKIATPVFISYADSDSRIYGCIIVVNETEDQPITFNSPVGYSYFITPFKKGKDATKTDVGTYAVGMDPKSNNNTLLIRTTITNTKLNIGKINDINIKIVDLWERDVNEGTVTVKINNKTIDTVPVTNGLATIQYTPQEVGNYTIEIAYQTDTGNFVQMTYLHFTDNIHYWRLRAVNATFTLEALLDPSNITIDSMITAQINDTISISASVTSDNTPITGGRVIFKVRDKILKDINGNVLFANVKDGKAVINNYTIPGDWIKPNTKMTAVYSGTSTIQSASSTIDLDISKIMPEIELEPQTVEVGKEVTLIAKVTSKQTTYSSDNNTLITSDTNKETITKPVNGGRVVFKINGRTLRDSNGNIIYGNVVDGIASITYTVPDSFTPKNYNITCVYGNKLYERNEGNTILTVKTNTKKIATKSLKTLTDTRIELSGETQVTIGGDTVITAKLVDATGNAINGVKISGYLGDTFISEESPTENGEVEFWIQNSVLSEARDYTFTAKSEETTEYAASTNSTIISVNKVETELTINEPLDIVVDVNTPVTINGTLTNATGGAIANAIINLNITDVGSVTNTTGSDGKYSYTWIPSKKGTFYVNATYDGNDKYGDAFASTYGDVDPLTTTITLNIKDGDEFLVNTPITISGTILDNNNNPPEHVLLTIRFNKINMIISAENGSYSHTTSYDQTPKYPRLYELSVEYAGNDTYNGDKITVTINVTSKMKTMMSVDEGPIDVVVTDNVTINGTLTDKEGMPIEGAEIEVSTGDLITTNSTGGYSYTYKADTVGENIPITFKYNGNKTYESTSAETSINVLKLNTTLRLTGTTQYTYGMPVIIKVNLTDAKGNPISDASIDGTISNMEGITTIITGNDGTAEFYITDLPVSEYTLTATYAGTDTKYNGNTTDIIFEINKLGTILSINPELENIDVNTQKTINGTLTDVNGNVLNGVNITMSITGMEEFNLTTDNNGKYSYTWTPTTVGTYTVKVIYDGSKIYEDAYNDTFFDVEPLSSTITVNVKNSDELRVDSPLNINGTLMDNNNPIADATLTIIFNGVSTNVNTDKDGLYKFDTTTPSYAGLYDLTVEYAGNDTYNGDEKTVKLDVKKISTDITVNKQETVLVPLDNIVINGTLTDEYNMPMKDAEITIAITGENNITVKTNDEGKYTYTYKTTKEGIYNVVVLYEGNDKYYESSANTSFNVEKIDSSITIDTIGSVDANSNVNVTGILVDSAQNAISNQEVTITVNNKKYTTTTGSDGKYVVTIMSPVVTGHYDVSASYAGSDVYTMASAQTSMFVKEETGITAEGPISATVNSTITITGSLMDASDNGIANATITVTFEGKKYTTTTNGDGKFTCDIMTTTVGDNIPVTVRYDGNDTYMASSEIINVDVEKLGSELTLNPVNNTDINSTVDVSGLLSEEYTQKAIANSTVTIIVDGISYNTVTDDNGNFKVTIKAAATTGTIHNKSKL